jgi:hypothetical protein
VRRITDVVTGVAAALVVFVAVPAVLITTVGLPLPHHWSRANVVSLHGAFDLLAIVAWVAWAVCSWQLARSVTRLVRRRDASTVSGAPVADWLATRIAAAVLTLVAVGGGLTTSSGAQPNRGAPQAQASATMQSVAPVGQPPAETADTTVQTDQPLPTSYTVEAGDTLWSIAEHLYGDGGEWSTIAQANQGHLMVDGTRFVDPSLILPGWVLTVPPAGATAAAPPATPAAQPVVTEAAATQPATPPPPLAVATAAPVHRQDPFGLAGAGGRSVHRAAHQPRRGPAPVPLPELAALGFGTLAAAAFARRARRARHLASLARSEDEAPAAVTAQAADTGSLLVPFLGAPILERLELANRHLGRSLAEVDASGQPSARLVVIGPHGVDVHLTAPVGWAPERWERHDERTWRLDATADVHQLATVADEHDPWLPLLLPVGDDDQGTWLVPLRPGDLLPVIGPDAEAMVAAMRAVAESWAWSEDLVVTDDPATAGRLAEGPNGAGRALLFIGNRAQLAPAARERAAVVTTMPVAATDLMVVIDTRAATVHPLGLTVRPSLLGLERQSGLADLVGPPVQADQAVAERPRANGQRPPRPRSMPRALATAPSVLVDPELFASARRPVPEVRAVEVRLLTAVPRIDGLAEPLDPKRARRATELVAYLALHHPDPVTSDRLRTRVLGSADADAASKTLFNTVGAARRAMGHDPDGRPLLPPASKSGHYRVSPLVTTDVSKAENLVADADDADADDEEAAIAMLRAALDLVEGEPLGGTLTGYGWWSAEGHERRIAATLVDGACRLARLAADHGYLDLARWGLERARLVEPYSELLSRAAMLVAAQAGDAERLRREWLDCQRRVDELDPGGLPSEATERLYADLRRRVPVHAGGDTEP